MCDTKKEWWRNNEEKEKISENGNFTKRNKEIMDKISKCLNRGIFKRWKCKKRKHDEKRKKAIIMSQYTVLTTN